MGRKCYYCCTGYVVGERILISDSVFKNNTVVNDIVIKIETVSAAGAILTTSRQSKVHAYAYHPDAATYNDVFILVTPQQAAEQLFNYQKLN